MANRPGDFHAADRIGPIEHDNFDVVLGPRFQDQAERADVRVIAAAHILDVVDQGVDALQQIGGRLTARAIEAVHRQTGFFVLSVTDVFIDGAADAVLGAEQGDEFDAVGMREQIDRRSASAIAAGVVGD